MKRKKSHKLIYCSSHIWKKIFLFKRNFVFKLSEKFFYNRSSVVPKIYSYFNIYIYSGKRWHTRLINKWMVGFKLGEFTWNRKLALYKSKQAKKKKAKAQAKLKKK